MRKYFIVLILIAMSFLQSCSSDSNPITSRQKLVSDGHLVSLKLDDQTSNVRDGLVAFSTDRQWLFSVNYSNNEIQLYDLDSKTLHKRMVFDREGPEGVEYISGIHVQSLDSIFLFGYPMRNLHLTDTSAKINANYKYKAPLGYSAAFVHNAHYNYTPVLSESKLLVNTKFCADPKTVTDDMLASKKLSYTIDLKNSQVDLLLITWPVGYNSSAPKLLDFRMAATDDILVYSLVADHNLYLTDLKGNFIKSVAAKSQ
jgi:hypothetical protein